MRALLVLRLDTLARSGRWVAPSVLFVVVVTVATWDDGGPLLPLYAVSSAGLLAAATWLGAATVNLESPAQRGVMLVTTGYRATLISQVAAALCGCVVLAIIGVAVPVAVGHHSLTAVVLLLGVTGQLSCACVGLGIAMLSSRWVLPRPGYAVLGAVLLVLLAVVLPGATPVNPMLFALSNDNPSTLIILALAAAAVAVLLACGELTHHVARHRD